MPDIKTSFEYIFKERRGLSKFIVPFLALFVFIVVFVLMLFALVLPAFTVGASDADAINLLMVGTSAIPFIGFSLLLMVVVLIYTLIITWYEYENTQAGMDKRPTGYIWRQKFADVIKRSLKLFIVNFIYTLPIIVVTTFLSVLISLFAPTSFSSLGEMTMQNLIYIIINYFLTFVVALIALIYNIYITIPAKLRLVDTNTFLEAFNFHRNMMLVKHNINKFGILTLYYIAYVVAVFILVTLVSFIAGIMPVVAVCFTSLAGLVLVLLSYHVTTFVIPHFLGAFYRTLKR